MLIKQLPNNKSKINVYNSALTSVSKRYPEINFKSLKITHITEKFIPYDVWLNTEMKDCNLNGIPDDSLTDFQGVFLAHSGWSIVLRQLTGYTVKDRRKVYWDKGVCDNATQVIDKYNELIEQKALLRGKTYIIVLTPVFKSKQSLEKPWRWNEYGPYIGIQNKQCDTLYDEKDIELVYRYRISEITYTT